MKLVNFDHYASVFINLDEPIEIIRTKAIFRRIACQARQDSRSVVIKDDLIKIDDDEFRISDLENIPQKYRVNLDPVSMASAEATDPPDARSKKPLVSTRTKPVKIKMTGLTFSGPSAYLLHMHRCQFVYKGNPYSAVEQGFHHQHAEFEQEFEITSKNMSIHNAYDIKDVAAPLPKSEAWGKIAQSIWKLNELKYEQNPDLKKQLLDTAPALLWYSSH